MLDRVPAACYAPLHPIAGVPRGVVGGLDEKVPSSLEVLSASGPAVQVSPILNSYLRFGSLLGVVVGFLLFVILWFAISLVPSNTADEKTAG